MEGILAKKHELNKRSTNLKDARTMKRPKPAGRDRAMTPEEFQAVLEEAQLPVRRQILALALTGCRPKEAWELTWDQVRDDRWILTRHKTRKTSRKPRVIYLNSAMRELMEELQRERGEEATVFLNCKGNLGP